ncbi:hybrid sensor histidine kinase/response regulator [bacterium]|nr:hybrid sensor histidine kinase/response regulator [bacterium]
MNQDNDLSNFSMLDLFRTEVENQVSILNEGLLALEKDPASTKVLESLMRAAHSLKGAARIVQIDPAVKVAHALEDCFVAAQKGKIVLRPEQMDVVLQGIDFLNRIRLLKEQELPSWIQEQGAETDSLVARIVDLASGKAERPVEPAAPKVEVARDSDPRTVRVQAENLNRLLAYAAETSVAASTLQTFVESLRLLKNQQKELMNEVTLFQGMSKEPGSKAFAEELLRQAEEIHRNIGLRYSELETYSRRAVNITKRLYREVLDSRMRPFRDGVEGFPRMVRDASRKLGKKVRFEIAGKSTKVDRDILEKLEAPLNHLLRNAIDHGIETPEERIAAGKPEEATLLLEASHKGGVLHIQISEDGRGVDFSRLRQKLLDKKLVTVEMMDRLSEKEMLEFLFLPGFSTTDQVTELSGRGVGLDIVYNMVREVGGLVQAFSRQGEGMTIHMQLPITLSILRALIVEISGELYAFPLSRIDKTLIISIDELEKAENEQFLPYNDERIRLVPATEILELNPVKIDGSVSVVLVSDALSRYGIVVDRFRMQKDLVVRPIDARLGKVKDLHGASILEDGSPVLILDVQDMLRSIDQLLLEASEVSGDAETETSQKRILVVEDSLTVRELERKLLKSHGYAVEVAVDGMDGWNALKTGSYALVVTDLDMPRLNGTELIKRIRADAKLQQIPVVMVSYKEREEEKQAALQAGANRFLSKTSFHDKTFLNAIIELIGEA